MAKKNIMRMRDRITITRGARTPDGFGGFTYVNSTVGTYWCYLKHVNGVIEDREGKSSLLTDYEIYFRKQTGENIQKDDVGTLETPNLKVRIHNIYEHDLRTIKATATSIE